MKKYCFLLFMVCSLHIFSQQASQQLPQNLPNSNVTLKIPNSYKKNKTNGIIMISIGGVALVSGVTLFADALIRSISAQHTYQQQTQAYYQNIAANSYSSQPAPVQPDDAENIPQMVGGVVLGAAGALITTVGTFMYLKGKRQQRWDKHVSIAVAPTSFRIAYKF